MKAAVVYWSGTGNTAAMADLVLEGMKSGGADAELIECSAVTDVIFIENEILSRNLLDAFKGFFTGIDQVVDNNHPVSLVQKLNTGMAADKASSTGNKNVHFCLLSV